MALRYKDSPDENPILDMYEGFLDMVEETIGETLPMNIRNKNYSIFRTYFEMSEGSIVLALAAVKKLYNTSYPYSGDFIKSAILTQKNDIYKGIKFLFPVDIDMVKDGEYKICKIIFLEKKDFFSSMGEKIKDAVTGLVGREGKAVVGSKN